jgi:hypothetical protein
MKKLIEYIDKQKEWSRKTFGNGKRTIGVTNHIRLELDEILGEPDSPDEWIDVVILALDGAWRTGASSEQIIERLLAKQQINFNRSFPFPESENHVSQHTKQS